MAMSNQVSYNCGEKCINRYMCTECEIASCPSGEYCLNRRFQVHQDAKVYPKPCEGKVIMLLIIVKVRTKVKNRVWDSLQERLSKKDSL